MQDDTDSESPSAATLQSALLDYYSAPGKYQLTLRQPAVLFGSIREILQLAAGRGAQSTARDAARLREASMFFIRAALLYPGADHYAVLGLPAGSDAPDLKERYRLLMRLIHPDFASGEAQGWPADAAVRVNKAYEVLSSSVLRREYDEQLAGLRAQRQAAAAAAPVRAAPPAARRRDHAASGGTKRLAWGLAIAAGFLLLLVLFPRQEPEHLVQRRPVAPPAERNANGAPPRAAAPSPTDVVAVARMPAVDVPVATPAPTVPAAPAPAAPVPAAVPPAAASVIQPAPAAALAKVPAAAPSAPRQVALAAPAIARPAPVEPPRSRPPELAVEQVAVPPPLPVPAPPIQPIAATSLPSASVTLPAASAVPVAKLIPSAIPNPVPTLSDAQPVLTQMLQLLESGSGEQLLRLLEADARQAPGAQALSRQYEQLVKGARPVRLLQVEFRGEPREGTLLVTGRIRFHAGEPTVGSHGQRMLLRAEFVSRSGKVLLTGLSGAPD